MKIRTVEGLKMNAKKVDFYKYIPFFPQEIK